MLDVSEGAADSGVGDVMTLVKSCHLLKEYVGAEVEQLWPGEKGQQMADEASSTPRQETGARRGGRGRQVSLIAPRVTICAWLAWPTWLRHNLRVAEGHGC